MTGFHDTLASWRGEDGTVAVPDDYDAVLTGAYDADMGAADELASAKVAELTAANEALAAELTKAKAANWDLLQAVPAETGAVSDPDNSENDTTPDTDADADIDNFFGD